LEDQENPMALKIRLRRMGRKKAPTYRIVVAESLMPRDGRFVDKLGHYNPRTEPVTLVVDRAKALEWIARGAAPTETVKALLKKAGVFSDQQVTEEIRAAPRAAAAAVAGAAGGVVERVSDAAGSAAETVAGVAGTAAEAVADAAGDAAEAVRETVAEVLEEVRERVAGDDEAGETAAEDEAEKAPE
jgi:small subunit ribosomal protein S16